MSVPHSSRRFSRRSIAFIGAATVLAVLLLVVRLHAMATPADLDLSRTRVSAHGTYRATYVPALDPIAVGRMHAWRLHLETAAGNPIDGATMQVTGAMPQHGHGLPTSPRVTRALGGGDYLVEGMKFNMGGWWTVTFTVTAEAGTDAVTFDLKL